jgi:pimeloyl-ACP methyl ester carboxylesterase
LNWSRALIVGHSWGGHLALRLVAALPRRLLGVLAVDPPGVVGDGGMAAFEAEMLARTPQDRRERAHELDARAMAGKGTPEEVPESMGIVWPAYFADPGNAPPMPPLRMSGRRIRVSWPRSRPASRRSRRRAAPDTHRRDTRVHRRLTPSGRPGLGEP